MLKFAIYIMVLAASSILVSAVYFIISKILEENPHLKPESLFIKFSYKRNPHRYLYKAFYSKKNDNGEFVKKYFNAFLYKTFLKKNESNNGKPVMNKNHMDIIKGAAMFLSALCNDRAITEEKKHSVMNCLFNYFERVKMDFSKFDFTYNNFKIVELKKESSLWKYSVVDLTNKIQRSFYDKEGCIKVLFNNTRFGEPSSENERILVMK